MGKTSLLRYVCEHAADLFPQNTVVICLDLLQGYARTRKDLLRALREKLAEQAGKQPWEQALDGDLGEFSRAMERLEGQGLRLVLCLDEVEKLAENEDEFGGLFDALRSAADGEIFCHAGHLSQAAQQAEEGARLDLALLQYLRAGDAGTAQGRGVARAGARTHAGGYCRRAGRHRRTGGRASFLHPAGGTQTMGGARFARGDPDWQSRALTT